MTNSALLALGATLVALVTPAHAQVSVCPGGEWTTGTTHPAGTGSNRLLVVALGGESEVDGANDFTAVTYGGQSLTLLTGLETSAVGFSFVDQLWYLDEAGIAAATSDAIAVTVTGPGFGDVSVAAVTYCNVDPSNPIGNTVSVEDSDATPTDPLSASLTVGLGNAAVAAIGCGRPGTFTWTLDLTESTDQEAGSSSFSTADRLLVAPAGTRTARADFSGTVNRNVMVVAEIVGIPAPSGISDGSFESQTPGDVPVDPWVTFGGTHVISPSGVSSDNGMPTDGTNWCEIGADTTNDATPPSNPGGVTAAPIGGAGIGQNFRYGAGQSILEFDAAFLRNEAPNETMFNDWMSIDVSDGATTYNVFYKDTFSPTSGTSVKYGYAMTAVESVTADLATLFPGSDETTVFRLRIQIGNGGDDFQPSKGYVDDVRLSSLAPVAEFAGSPLSGTAPLAVSFSDLSNGLVTSWSWDFGDGATSTQQNPSHTYTSSGSYTVALTVTGPGGNDGETKTGYITVNAAAPVAEFTGSPLSGTAPLAVGFTDQSAGEVSSWSWDFGDGATSTQQNPSHTYTSSGSYTVALTVTGPGGNDGETKTGYIAV
ncbi:MAG: PKD domain-containing protein, partial [bacterium]|nr:PKD domain-containing protein [bacterium]